MSQLINVGFIGTGLMGKPMCERLLEKGHKLIVWNRTREKLHELQKAGAVTANSPGELAERCDVVCFCLTDAGAVEEVVFGKEGVAGGMRPQQIIVDFSSIGAAKTKKFSKQLADDVQGAWIDAPVSGGVDGAVRGTLTIFAGGEEKDIKYVESIFSAVASRTTHLGATGAGQIAKSCNQMIVGCNLLVIAEMVATARKIGLNVERLPQALAGGFADSRPLQIFGPRMAAKNAEPKIGAIGTMLKDLDEAASLGNAAGVPTPMTRLAADMYRVCSHLSEHGLEADATYLLNVYEDFKEKM